MDRDRNSLFTEMKRQFAGAVGRNQAEGILFSGGLDSALVAVYSGKSTAISVGLEEYGEDRQYAERVANFLGLDLCNRIVTIEEAISAIPEVIKILRSFDPAIPNDVTVYLGLKCAKDMGIKSVMTGDGSDEVFGGYDFLFRMKDVEAYLARMHASMQFSSNRIGESMGIAIRQPFLDAEFWDFSRAIDLDLKIRKDRGRIRGKWILRKAFEGMLPQEILWQGKRPLEYGSGMTELRSVIESQISDEEFKEGLRAYPIRFWNKEHFYYYRLYREVVGEIPAPEERQKTCPCCGAGMNDGAFHCKICGGVTQWEGV